jgi:hypothetical protein
MMVRTESVYRRAARQEFQIDLALYGPAVNFKTPRGFLVASSLLIDDSCVARERLLGGKASGAQVRGELLDGIFGGRA